jgi:hypothetical protein
MQKDAGSDKHVQEDKKNMQKDAGSDKHVQEDKKNKSRTEVDGGRGVDSISKHDESTKAISKVMPCWA